MNVTKKLSVATTATKNPVSSNTRSNGKVSDPVELYFSQIRKTPLLTREEEIELAKTLEESKNQLRRLVFQSRLGQQRAITLLAGVLDGREPMEG